ncbi:MAG: hypothetical protein IBX69_06245 [Anaerolineales bacterium]|nr:hypothetical protein [Anaerolineales bacterium]
MISRRSACGCRNWKYGWSRALWRVARVADHPGAGRLRQRVLRVPRADRGRAGAVWVEVGSGLDHPYVDG